MAQKLNNQSSRELLDQHQLVGERDHLRLLLEVNNTLVSNLGLRELLSAISVCLRRVLPQDMAALVLYDPSTNALRPVALDFPEHEETFIEDEVVPLDDENPASLAFSTRRPAFGDARVDERATRLAAAGATFCCFVPLVSRDRALGVIGVGRMSDNAFTEQDAVLLTEVAQQVAIAVENALAFREIEALKNKLEEEKLYLEEEICAEYNFGETIGNSVILKRALQDVETVAATESNVLICGETGTGKELIARAIHNLSSRSKRTLVKVNCAAIPTGLLESELFGHEKGAFTGAIERRTGRFETAEGGTIFLDEVEDIPLELQSKLLRVIQEREFERLGSSRTIRADVRIVTATNADLAELVAEKKFRSDLYYRLNVFPITLPPLRERRDDIPLLVRFFTHKFARQMKRKIERIPSATMAALTAYHYPGNIRELQNIIERAVIISRGRTLELPLAELKAAAKSARAVSPEYGNDSVQSNGLTLEAVEREHILSVLRESEWVIGGVTGAAARLGINRTTLNNRLKKLGINRPRPLEPGMLMRQPPSIPIAPIAASGTDRKAQIEAVLRETRGKVSGPHGAATRLGVPATTLNSQIRVLGINKYQFK
jgi:formate hydrogenlyase transcriptional activator